MADGEWFTLEQQYQKIYGAYQIDTIAVPIENGRLRGEDISFTVNSVVYQGRIKGNTMAGVANGRVSRNWSATRAAE